MQAGRIPSIDGLRGIAAITVMLYHFGPDYFDGNEKIQWLWFGDYGPQIFFMISGLVIGLVSSHKNSSYHFIKKRYKRLMPTYWAALTLTSVLLLFSITDFTNHATQYLANLTLAQEAFGFSHMDAVYWTLIVEVLFYIAFALIFLPVKILETKFNLLLFWLSLSFISLIFRVMGVELNWALSALRQVLILDYAPLFIIGIVMSLMKKRLYHKGFILLILGCYFHMWVLYPSHVAAYLSGAFVLFSALVFYDSPLLSSKYSLILGWISYPLYLLHREIGYLIIRQFEVFDSPVSGVALATLVSVALAYGFAIYFDSKGKPQEQSLC